MSILAAILAGLILILLYKRYVPVTGIPCRHLEDFPNGTILDIRDYNQASKKPVEGAVGIPTAYLERYIDEIPDRKVFVVASNRLEKNVGIRLLRKRGYKVTGYTLTDCGC